jgi:hypothetical protein
MLIDHPYRAVAIGLFGVLAHSPYMGANVITRRRGQGRYVANLVLAPVAGRRG